MLISADLNQAFALGQSLADEVRQFCCVDAGSCQLTVAGALVAVAWALYSRARGLLCHNPRPYCANAEQQRPSARVLRD